MSKRSTIALAIGTLAAALTGAGTAATATPASATAISHSQVSEADSTPAAPLATCNYLVWPVQGINVHAEKDRSSRILQHFNQNEVLYGLNCGNSEGGRYGSCGSGILWKSYGVGWLATKCLARV
ncbi:hypothetical protein [Nonomuraea cavernae]|uniref:Secreted protein n=1 Tax=Nonomuraea cavernae TaxID=2045107 RepID=A0A918DNI4_9ACTN|nr:hypothetical protein [Nonomuraea cavernae]MCA2189195.1 hypothetical protein [Nonomuraea cavernae]GGO76759.1 hypothetical protein GCM10012289_54840 [Nonomuraea cavernae]